jgi:hypothetical protein
LFGVPRFRPPRRSPGFDPLMECPIATVCYFSKCPRCFHFALA